jgi:DNA-binding transcriptional regulator GbsR (MarR family)
MNFHMDAKSEFIEAMGRVSEASGLPPTAGRIAGLLMLSDTPVSFSQLAERLGVSRGSISTNTRALLQQGTIERASIVSGRETFFQSATRMPYRAVLEHQLEVNQQAIDAIAQVAPHFLNGPREIEVKLSRHRLFVESINALIRFHITLLESYELAAKSEYDS